MKQYDYIFAGGGCAGLSLAYYLSQSPLRGKRVLIIDAERKQYNDRTWCFWADRRSCHDDIVSREWPVLSFADEKGERPNRLGSLRYKMIRGEDFYRKVHRVLSGLPNFEFLQARVTGMGESGSGAYVIADGQRLEASWVFNSALRDGRQLPNSPGRHFLLQHFAGWWIRSEDPIFSPEKGTLMDFRTPQYLSTRFFYVLPLSEREALVEYTVFSRNKLHPKSYERALEAYITDILGAKNYTVFDTEQGAIPMTDQPFPATASPHVINIGTAGGAVKPTTGYAFQNIQVQARSIVAQLLAGRSPAPPPPPASRFRFYDSLLLNILQDFGEEGQFIFSALFRNNDIARILRFLNEETSVWEEARIFASLPIISFLRALVRVKLLSGWRRRWAERKPSGGALAPGMAYGLGKGPEAGAGGQIQGTAF